MYKIVVNLFDEIMIDVLNIKFFLSKTFYQLETSTLIKNPSFVLFFSICFYHFIRSLSPLYSLMRSILALMAPVICRIAGHHECPFVLQCLLQIFSLLCSFINCHCTALPATATVQINADKTTHVITRCSYNGKRSLLTLLQCYLLNYL